jgi:predicted enzyme related to lactoylglutathione lyase
MGIQLTKPAVDVGIVTTDFGRMMAFYRDVLGFPAEEPVVFPGIGTIHRLLVGESILRLLDPETAPPKSATANDSVYAATGFRYMTIVVKNLDDVLDACRNFGIDIPGPPKEIRPGVFVRTIQDPDGNWIELQSR